MSTGFIDINKSELFPKNPFSIKTRLKAAHPSSNDLLFFALNDTCIKNQCGHDIDLLEYIAEKLNMDIRQFITFN